MTEASDNLDNYVESTSFFERMLGSARLLNSSNDADAQAKSEAKSTRKALPDEPHSKT